MKNWNYLLVLVIFSVSLVSCGKNIGDIGDPAGDNEIETSMTAKINGEVFSSKDVVAQISIQQGATKTIVLGGEDGGQDIGIFIYDYNGVGTYTGENNNSNFTNTFQYKKLDSLLVNDTWQVFNKIWSTNSPDGIASIEITKETDAYVDGVFSFSCSGDAAYQVDFVAVTEGKFHARK